MIPASIDDSAAYLPAAKRSALPSCCGDTPVALFRSSTSPLSSWRDGASCRVPAWNLALRFLSRNCTLTGLAFAGWRPAHLRSSRPSCCRGSQRRQLRVVPGLAGGEQHRQRPAHVRRRPGESWWSGRPGSDPAPHRPPPVRRYRRQIPFCVLRRRVGGHARRWGPRR
jgi:hypothetical protein